LLKRVITAVIGLPLVIFVVHTGGWLLLLMCLALSLVGLRELFRAFSKKDKPVHVVGYAFTVFYFISIYFFGYNLAIIGASLFIIAVQTCMVLLFPKVSVEDGAITVFGFLYVPFLFSFILLTREFYYGHFFVWLIFTISFGCDTFAYMTGVSIGRHKLTNSPSPKKSVEGIIGGVLGAALVGWLYGFFIVRFGNSPYSAGLTMGIATSISLLGAGFSVIGDMSASAIKRHTGIKDFGALLPGHGGVLDRADSILFVAPFVYLAMIVVSIVII